MHGKKKKNLRGKTYKLRMTEHSSGRERERESNSCCRDVCVWRVWKLAQCVGKNPGGHKSSILPSSRWEQSFEYSLAPSKGSSLRWQDQSPTIRLKEWTSQSGTETPSARRGRCCGGGGFHTGEYGLTNAIINLQRNQMFSCLIFQLKLSPGLRGKS